MSSSEEAFKVILDPSQGLLGKDKLLRKFPKFKKEIEETFLNQEAFLLNRPLRKKYPRRPTISPRPFYQLQSDILDFSDIKDSNDGYRYVLIVIDVFSRIVWARIQKTKNANETTRSMKSILEEIENSTTYQVARIQTDRDTKAAIAERFNRTLRLLIRRYQVLNNTLKYIDVLPSIISNYNNTPHRSLGNLTPIESLDNIEKVKSINKKKLDKIEMNEKERKFKVGDYVRISRIKNNFEKEQSGNFTIEVFQINKVNDTIPTTYRLIDLNDDPISEERKVGRSKEYLIKWRGYPEKFNSWVKASEIKNINK